MGIRLELEDLPPRYRKQAERQIRQRKERTIGERTPEGPLGPDAPESERRYYRDVIVPRMQRGEVVRVLPRKQFLLLPAREYCGIKMPAAHYTPDFLLELPGGQVEAVEVKSKFTRKAQRDYIYRRRLFVDLVCEPQGWRFTEYIQEGKP